LLELMVMMLNLRFHLHCSAGEEISPSTLT